MDELVLEKRRLCSLIGQVYHDRILEANGGKGWSRGIEKKQWNDTERLKMHVEELDVSPDVLRKIRSDAERKMEDPGKYRPTSVYNNVREEVYGIRVLPGEPKKKFLGLFEKRQS